MQRKILSLVGTIIFFGFLFPLFASAVDAPPDLQGQIEAQLGGTAAKAEVGAPLDPRIIVASIIKVFLTILGTVFFILMIVSGYWLVTARGEEEKETKAKDTIRSAVIGLIIVLMAYAITIFVSVRIQASVAPLPRGSSSP